MAAINVCWTINIIVITLHKRMHLNSEHRTDGTKSSWICKKCYVESWGLRLQLRNIKVVSTFTCILFYSGSVHPLILRNRPPYHILFSFSQKPPRASGHFHLSPPLYSCWSNYHHFCISPISKQSGSLLSDCMTGCVIWGNNLKPFNVTHSSEHEQKLK